MRSRIGTTWVALVLTMTLAGPGAAEPPGIPSDGARVLATRTEAPPRIDGRLDDPAWTGPAAITQLTQVEPLEGAAAGERTEIRILRDDRTLYFGIRCFDSAPDRIRATQMRRDGDLDADDRIGIVLDTFRDRRNGYLFEINPVGARRDGRIENNDSVRTEWDGIWYGRARIDRHGWTAEIAIPMQTLSFDPATDRFGLNIERVIRRRNEVLRWAAPFQSRSLTNLSDTGVMAGLSGLEQGLGLDVVPSVAIRRRDDRRTDRRHTNLEPSLDLFYRPTPSLTAAFTTNTDFSEAEVDERRINLSRFSLFFPETRDFFLADAGIFDFGGLDRNGIPFHSRRIGIGADRGKVDIRGALRLTGRVGPFDIGLIDAQMAEQDEVSPRNLSVARLRYLLPGESYLGAIVTHGDPASDTSNSLVGFDARYRTSELFGHETFEATGWVQQSHTPGLSGRDAAFGFELDYPNDRLDATLGFTEIQENFRPALGFVNRSAIQQFTGQARWRWRPERWLRKVDTGFEAAATTRLDHTLESLELQLELIGLENDVGDEFDLTWQVDQERLDGPFEISDGVILPAGRYDFDRLVLELETAESRPVRLDLTYAFGEFYSGQRRQLVAGLELRPSRHLFVGLEYEQNAVRLAEGDFDNRLVRLRFDLAFTPDLSWNTFAQWDDESQELGINSRVRWIVQPGSELFVVWNRSFDTADGHIRGLVGELTTKLGWTFRF